MNPTDPWKCICGRENQFHAENCLYCGELRPQQPASETPTPTPNAFHDALVTALFYDPSTGSFTWRNTGTKAGFPVSGKRYRGIGFQGSTYRTARLAWFYVNGRWPVGVIDHINGDRNDDRIENLRDVTTRGNNSNHAKHRNGKLVGATFERRGRPKPWFARIKINGKDKRLGYFHTEQEAHAAYMAEKERLGL